MKKSSFQTAIALLLSFAMLLSLSACAGSAAKTAATGGAENKAYTFAHNKFGSGAYPLEIIVKEAEAELAYFGGKLRVADNEFTVDKVVTDLQAQLAAGVDGVEIFAVADTLFETMGDACTQAKVPFVLYDKTPTDEKVIAKLAANPLFIGSISAEEYNAGRQMGEKAVAEGSKTAIIIRAAIGDYSMDQRDAGFTEAFEKAGGKVLGRAICANPTEAVTKANDLLTAYPDADCMYGCGGDFGAGGVSALQTRTDVNQKMKVYITDISPDLAKKLLDGAISGVNGGQWVAAAISNTLLINYLDGHPILDKDGKAPWFRNLQMVDLPKDKAQKYIDLMAANGSPISKEEYQKLLFRYNPDVSYQTYMDFLSSYSDTFMAKLK